MTLLDKIKQLLGSEADREIEDSTVDEKSEKDVTDIVESVETNKPEEKIEEAQKDDSIPTETVEVTEAKKIFDDGWFNEVTGKINTDLIHDDDVRDAINKIAANFNKSINDMKIADKVNQLVHEKYPINVNMETLKKVLDLSSVKVNDDGSVVGVEEAFDAMKSAEPAFFKDRSKNLGPVGESFAPVVKSDTLSTEALVALAYGANE